MAVAGAPSAPSSYVGGRTGVMFAGVLGMIALIMASTMINVAVPHIMGAYGLGQDQAHWMSSGFLAAMTVSMLANAALVTRFGARTVFLGAILIFTAASIAGLAGVEHAINLLMEEIDRDIALIGVNTLEELNRELIHID